MVGMRFGAWLAALALVGCVPSSGGDGGSNDGGAIDRGPEADAVSERDAEADADPEVDADPEADACLPACGERVCGDDGCGGVCGVCGDDTDCVDGACVEPPAGCGDGACGEGESCRNCPADCGDCCGDGRCTDDENCFECPEDCGCPGDRFCNDEGICEPEPCHTELCGAPPRILTFNANTRALTEGGEVILSAVVTDPDGIGDLIGGVLEDPGGASYGAFSTQGEEGAYGMTLSWAALHAVRPIEFDGEATRTVVAAFFDQAGNRTAQTMELTLHCRDAGGAACAGHCVSLDSPEHCGACGAACGDVCRDRACVCPEGLTRCDGVCLDTGGDPENCGRCGEVCPGAVGGAPSCVDGACEDPCPGLASACDGVCTDVTGDVDHCGACDRSCDAPEGGAPACRRSRCEVDCDPGRRLCDDLCAPCPEEGVAGTACSGDQCVALRCEADYALCEGMCAACPRANVRETACADDRCVATACAPRFHPCAEGCCAWRTEVVDVGGVRFDMKVDGRGVHVAIGDRESVRYGLRTDDGWVWEPVYALDQQPQNQVAVSLLLGPDGPVIAFSAIYPPPAGGAAPSELIVMRRGADGWQRIDRIGGGGSIVRNPSLASDGRVTWVAFERGVAYVGDLAAGLAQAEPASEVTAWEPHLVVGPGDALHLAYWQLIGRRLGYAVRGPDGGFEPVDPQGFPASGLQPRVALDRNDEPVILHRDDIDRLLVTRSVGGAWQTRELVPGHAAQVGHDLIRGPDARLVGCFGSQLGAFVFQEDGNGFATDEIANGAGVWCRVGVGPDHALHVMYQGDGGLTYAR